MHNGSIGSFYWQKRSQHGYRPILIMSVNGASTIVSFETWVCSVPIGGRHPFMRYWQPLLVKTIVKCSLRHPANECQWSVNSFWTCTFCSQGITQIFGCINELLSTLLGTNTIYWRWNTNTKLIDIANHSTGKSSLMFAECVILIQYNWHTAKTRAIYESIDGPADNRPNSARFGDCHWTVSEWAVRVLWRRGPLIWQGLGLDPDRDLKWQSGTGANSTVGTFYNIVMLMHWMETHFRLTVMAPTDSQQGNGQATDRPEMRTLVINWYLSLD
jgi:hypothetical protein